MAEALHELTWVSDIRGALGWHGLAEYLQLWEMVADITLNTNEEAHQWRFESTGIFSTDWPTALSSLAQLPLNLGSGFGNPGHWGNAKPLFGWLSAIVAGLLTGYKRGDFHIQSIAPFATRRMKRFNICSPHVYLLDNSGSAFYSP
jgi:hypothetical protein